MQTAHALLAYAAERKLCVSAIRILLRIFPGHCITLSSLATELGISTAAITGLADSLEKANAAKRIPYPSDRRAFALSITPETHADLKTILHS